MPLVEQELLILPEKMSSPKVLMGVHIARSLVSCFLGGGGTNPPFYIGPLRGPIFLGPVVKKKIFLSQPLYSIIHCLSFYLVCPLKVSDYHLSIYVSSKIHCLSFYLVCPLKVSDYHLSI